VRKVLLFSLLLLAGLFASQLLPALGAAEPGARTAIRIVTVWLLGFIMIHVGYEFELDRSGCATTRWTTGSPPRPPRPPGSSARSTSSPC
jgi:hypothetical protein